MDRETATPSAGDYQVRSPIVFIVFNRPGTTKKVFAEIARARPSKLLVIADGARADRPGEAERCAEARRIATAVDWPCEVLTDFSDINLGCRRRVSSGLDWAFSQVDEAIIIEDDCLPDPSFFRFCDELLERHRHDQRIGMIAGSNFAFGARRNEDSYSYSRMVLIWGWATWGDRWRQTYDVNLARWPGFRSGGWLRDLVGRRDEAHYFTRLFDASAAGRIDAWSTQWIFANWAESRLNIVPNVNLVSNIGFGPEATHTRKMDKTAAVPTAPMIFPLRHPEYVVRNDRLDRLHFRTLYYRSPLKRVTDRMALYWQRAWGRGQH